MLLQALRVEFEMKNLNLQVTFLVKKGVGTRSHTKERCGNVVPTPLHPCISVIFAKTCMHSYSSDWSHFFPETSARFANWSALRWQHVFLFSSSFFEPVTQNHSLSAQDRGTVVTRAVESGVPSSESDSDSGQFRLSDSNSNSNSDSGPTPTFSWISYL